MSRKNLISLIVVIIILIALPVTLNLVRQTQIFTPRAAGEPILFSGPNVITRNGAQKLRLDDQGKANVGLQLISPIGPPLEAVGAVNPPANYPTPQGGIINPPPPVGGSSNSKRVFVTSTRYNGNLGGLSGADAKCQERANAANLGGTWKAWLSDSNTSAAARLNQFQGPFVRLDGVTVAQNWNDLIDGSLVNGISVSELRTNINYYVFTASNIDGTSRISSNMTACSNWTTSDTNQYTGDGWSLEKDQLWTNFGVIRCNFTDHLYCFEQ